MHLASFFYILPLFDTIKKVKNMLDVLIIGGGPAGLYASHLASNSGLSYTLVEASFELGGKLRLFEDKPVYDYPGKDDYIGKDILNQLMHQMHQEKYQKYIKLSTTITSIETIEDGFISTTQDNASILSKYVLITNGGGMFIPRPLGIKDEERFENLHYHIKDASLFKHKKLVMFGGGDTATDWAHYFMKQGSHVTLVHRRDDFRGDESLIQDIKSHTDVYTPYKLLNVTSNDHMISKVSIMHLKTKEVMDIDCDHVFAFYGTIPVKTSPLNDHLELHNQKLIVTTSMETSIKGIYACGNGITYPGKQSMIITAFGEVATAMGSIIYQLYPDKIPSYKRL